MGTSFQSGRQEHLSAPQKCYVAPGHAQLLPQKAHQPVRLCAAAAIALTARDQQHPRALPANFLAREGLRDGFGEALDQQRMAAIDVIVKNLNVPMSAAEFRKAAAERFALPQVPFERGRQYEDFCGARTGLAFKKAIDAVLTGMVRRVHGERTQTHSRGKSEDAGCRIGETFRLRRRTIPIGMVWKQIGRDEEYGFSHVTQL